MKKVIVVGAGIAGLSAGIYALQSGFDVTIYESHTIPGGASTSWRRKGYLFEGGLHWLTGSSKEIPLNKLWREVGALDDNVPVYILDPFLAFEYENQTAYLYRDIEKFRNHLMELSPDEEKEINCLCKDIKKFLKISMPIMDIKGVKVNEKSSLHLSEFFKLLPAINRMSFYSKQSAREYANRFKSPIIKRFLENIIGPDSSSIGMIMTIATLASGDGGYPLGGSLSMTKRMADKFEKLGGKIHYGMAVSKVSVQNGLTNGVIINGEHILADAVIVTQDTLVAIDKLFDQPIHEPWAEKMRKNAKPMLDTFISVGVKADLSDLPERIQFISDKSLICGGVTQSIIGINNYAGHKGYAPEGCTAITSIIMGDSYDFWKNSKKNGTYQAEKEKLAGMFIEILTKKYPQISGKIEVWDVATPLTYERYLGSYKGSWMSIMEKGSKRISYPSKAESIQNIYFASQRLMSPGGLPVALQSGRKAVQYLCRDTNTVFQVNK